MNEKPQTTMEALERVDIALGALVKPFVEALQSVLDRAAAFYAHWQSHVLERQGRLCRDKRKRNRYFRRAKRLRRDYPLGKTG